MKTCPKCSGVYPGDGNYCPTDGQRLIQNTESYIGQIFMDQFEIREVTGRGSMGTVYKAWQTGVGREVAVKVLNRALRKEPQLVTRFNREARAAAQLSHPNIIIVFLVGETEDQVPFLAMEFIDGRSLAAVCEEEGPFPSERTIHVARQITSALAEAHRNDIVHRDLKAENILLSDRPDSPDFVKVVDFGIAKILSGVEDGNLTATGAVFGTPHYLSPEQASGKKVDNRSDIYALGVILFYMCTGRLPFEGESGMGLLVQHIKEPPPRPQSINPSIPHALEEVILRCMEKSPDDRYQTARELDTALEEAEEQIQSSSVPTLRRFSGEVPRPAATAKPRRRAQSSTGSGAPVEVVAPATVDPAEPRAAAPVPVETETPVQRLEAVPAPPPATDTGGLNTLRMARRVVGRRHFVLHILGAVAATGAGAGVGYAAYYRKSLYDSFEPDSPGDRPSADTEPAPEPAPEPEPEPEPRPAPEPEPEPEPKKPKPRPKRKPKRKPRRKPKPKPRPKPKPKPEPKPKPAEPPPIPKPEPIKPAGPDPAGSSSDGEEDKPPVEPAPPPLDDHGE